MNRQCDVLEIADGLFCLLNEATDPSSTDHDGLADTLKKLSVYGSLPYYFLTETNLPSLRFHHQNQIPDTRTFGLELSVTGLKSDHVYSLDSLLRKGDVGFSVGRHCHSVSPDDKIHCTEPASQSIHIHPFGPLCAQYRLAYKRIIIPEMNESLHIYLRRAKHDGSGMSTTTVQLPETLHLLSASYRLVCYVLRVGGDRDIHRGHYVTNVLRFDKRTRRTQKSSWTLYDDNDCRKSTKDEKSATHAVLVKYERTSAPHSTHSPSLPPLSQTEIENLKELFEAKMKGGVSDTIKDCVRNERKSTCTTMKNTLEKAVSNASGQSDLDRFTGQLNEWSKAYEEYKTASPEANCESGAVVDW